MTDHVGVSNFGIRELQHLLTLPGNIGAVQNWMDPLHQDRRVRDFCSDHGIPYVAYSVLGTQWLAAGYSQNPVLNHPVIVDVAHSMALSPAVVVLKWAVQSGAHIIPRSKNVRD